MQSGWALGMVSEKITQSIGLVVRSPRQPASEQLRLAYKITRIRSVPLNLVVGLALLTVSPVVLAQSSSDAVSETTQPPRANADVTAPTSAEAENTPRWKFDIGVSISPLFGAFFDESSCCTPLGGWVTVGSGRFRLQVDYVRNVQRWGGFTDSYEHLGGQEIVVERALGGTQVEQVGGVTAYWRLSKNPRWNPAPTSWNTIGAPRQSCLPCRGPSRY